VLARYLEPTQLIPTDGIVRDTARGITEGAKTDADKARAIYEWIVENTFRDPKVRGCGLGDIKTMLETRYFGGKCADLNALYVGRISRGPSRPQGAAIGGSVSRPWGRCGTPRSLRARATSRRGAACCPRLSS
jgi:hypothetical protein